MTTREAARPLRRYMRARVRAASLAPTYTITRDVTNFSGISNLFHRLRRVLGRRAIPPDLLDHYDMLSRSFGVTDSALANFFRILGETKVATGDLDSKLREIAGRHVTLLLQAETSTNDDPQIAAIKTQAVAAIGAGDYDRAEELLQRG